MPANINIKIFVPHSFEIVDVRPIGSASIVQTRARHEHTQGFYHTINLGKGLFATWCSVTRNEAMVEQYDSNGSIKINLRLEGESDISATHHGPYAIKPMMCTALLLPKGKTKFEHFESGIHEKSVTISVTRTHLVEELGLLPDNYDGSLCAFLRGKPYKLTFLQTEFGIELKQAAEAFFTMHTDSFFKGLLLRAKASDILRLFFSQMQNDNAKTRHFLQSEINLIEQVKSMLNDNIDTVIPSIDIATNVGCSLSRLTRLFKTIEGRTINEYVTACRMAKAVDLMREKRLTITQIAFEVGYEHSANFSTAFRRHYGMTPRQAMHGIKPTKLY